MIIPLSDDMLGVAQFRMNGNFDTNAVAVDRQVYEFKITAFKGKATLDFLWLRNCCRVFGGFFEQPSSDKEAVVSACFKYDC